MGTSPLALFWPQDRVNGTGLEYPVAEGTGKWIEFHNQPRDGAWSVERGHEDTTTRGDDGDISHVRSDAFDGDPETVRPRRAGRENGDEDGVMV
jgi:hypothetical protein